jgi:hypothetical protein
MIENLQGFTIFLVLATIYSVLWGKVLLFNAQKKHIKKFARFLMRFTRMEYTHLHSAVLGALYLGGGLLGCIIFSIAYGVNILKYFTIKPEYIIYIVIGIIAEMSVSSLIISLVIAFKTDVDWVKQIRTIPWINSISLMPERIGPIIPTSGAFFEEMFFRGVLFIIMLEVFPQIGVIIPIAVVTVLFAVQQILNTETFHQGAAMAIASLSVSGVGCLLIIYTGSFLPALIAHESFVIFYFSQMGFSYKKV